jgi:uncharacterized surface protein with fasciclin (FAS1) repeats
MLVHYHWAALSFLVKTVAPMIASANRDMETSVKPISTVILTAALALPLALSTPSRAQDIVDVAVGNKDFTTLVAAIKAAGLVETLKGKGPFTVFAPTDAAFKKLPAATLEGLLKPESKAKLATILKYHVLPGAFDAARLSKAKVKAYGIKSVEGTEVKINLTKGVVVSGATVTQPDIKASNGVIHVVDTVMLPTKIKTAMRAAELREKAVAAATALKAKAAEAATAAKAKAADLAAKAKDAAAKVTTPATAPATPTKKP